MKKFLVLFFILLLSNTVLAQNVDPNDCVNAITVCGNGDFVSDATGIGAVQEVNGCSGFEHNSIWLKITIAPGVIPGSTLGFDIIPNDSNINVDYDFWVFGPNKACGALGSPIRCCTTNPALAGLANNHTGMYLSTLSVTAGPGANGNGYVRSLTVLPGQTYYICIDRPVGDGGFTLQWTGTATVGTGAFSPPPVANTIPDYKTCSNTPNIGIFDFNSVRALVNADLVNNTVDFYNSLSDAIAQNNPFPNLIGNSTNPQVVYTRVTDNVTGCYSTSVFNLIVYPVPNVAVSASSSSICQGDSVTITFSGTPSANFDYTVNGGTVQTAILDATGTFSFIDSLSVNTVYSLSGARILDSLGNVVCLSLIHI